MGEELKDKIKKAQHGNKDALNDLVKENYGLICSISRRFENRGYDIEDIRQTGAIGFIKAVKKFDFTFNVMLSTFAVTYIIGEIRRFLRDDGPVKISRELKQLASKISLEKKNNPEITIGELSEKLSASKENIVLAIESSNMPESLEAKTDDDSISLLERLSANENGEDKIIEHITLNKCIKELKPRDREIIYLRYYKGQTQKKVAKIIGVSQVQISRIEKQLLKEMHDKLKEA